MLFGPCAQDAAASFLPAAGSLCAGGAGFVTAMMATLAANGRTAPAKTLRGEVPAVDRLAVRMVTDNIVIQFLPNETRDGLTIERKSGNTHPDKPPRTILNGEWGLAMQAQSFRGDARAQRDGRFRLHAGSPAQQHGNPQDRSVALRRHRAQPRPLRSFRRHGRLSQSHQGQAQEQAAVLRRRRGLLLPAPQPGRQFRRARPPGDPRGRAHADDGLGAGDRRRPRLHHRPHRPDLVRKAVAGDRRDRRHLRRLRLLPRKDAGGEEYRRLHPGRFRARARHRLPGQGQRPGGAHLVQPSRRHQHRARRRSPPPASTRCWR